MLVRFEKNRFLTEYLSSTGPAGVFARWVVEQRPDTNSIGVFFRERLIGAAILGPSIGLPQALSCWIFTESSQAFRRLLSRLQELKVGPISFCVDLIECFNQDAPVSIDHYYVMKQTADFKVPMDSEVEYLSKQRLAEIVIPSEMGDIIGNVDNIPDDFPYFGVVQDKILVSIAEAVIRDTSVASIQQVFTIPARRGQGLSKAVVGYLAQTLLRDGITPTYFVSEDNVASVALAKAVGFELHSRWGYAELG